MIGYFFFFNNKFPGSVLDASLFFQDLKRAFWISRHAHTIHICYKQVDLVNLKINVDKLDVDKLKKCTK